MCVNFSIATHLEAPILLEDEVLAVGDASFRRKCIHKIEERHQAGRTIILITHSPETICQHCTRCIVTDQQKKIFDGSAEEDIAVYIEKNA